MIKRTIVSLAVAALSISSALSVAPALAATSSAHVHASAQAGLKTPAATTLTTAASAVVPDSLPAATPAPGTGKASDIIWRKIMLGTWQAVDSPDATTINGEATFTPDGKAVGYTTATYVYNDGSTSDVKVAMKFRWRIENGIITLDQFESDPAGFIKSTQVRRFEIQSMNDTGAVFKDLADGEPVYRRRKPG